MMEKAQNEMEKAPSSPYLALTIQLAPLAAEALNSLSPGL